MKPTEGHYYWCRFSNGVYSLKCIAVFEESALFQEYVYGFWNIRWERYEVKNKDILGLAH